MDERELVRWLQERGGQPTWPVVLGIGDDMGAVEVGSDKGAGGAGVLITADMLLDGVHFDASEHSLAEIGRKAVACSLSDCAAMAVKPIAATVSVAWPKTLGPDRMKELFEGMWVIARKFDCAIVGGDTTSWSNPLAIDVAMVAERYRGHRAIRRTGLQRGDTLYVTGPLGGSRLGTHMTFTPRVREAHSIATAMGGRLHGMIDISDGLAVDLHRLCESSGVGAELAEGLLARVVSDHARQAAESDGTSPMDHALFDGEDFELLLAVAGDAPEPPAIDDEPLIPIGTVTASGVHIKKRDGQVEPLPPKGYDHLS